MQGEGEIATHRIIIDSSRKMLGNYLMLTLNLLYMGDENLLRTSDKGGLIRSAARQFLKRLHSVEFGRFIEDIAGVERNKDTLSSSSQFSTKRSKTE